MNRDYFPVIVESTGIFIVSETNIGADENFILNINSVINGNVILNFAIIPYCYAMININILANNAI